jgi:hypothetical protein
MSFQRLLLKQISISNQGHKHLRMITSVISTHNDPKDFIESLISENGSFKGACF